ncbi:MAG: GNAT family N-acetyltransferase [Blastocatellia bacterium]|nr:GNAT family N-acetyltransferase [Blastocatellia bacterium]
MVEDISRDVPLRDGAVLRLRWLRPTDREGLVGLFNRCSPETIRYRFLRMVTELTGSMLDHLVSADGRRHVALVVTQGEAAEERIIAVGRYFVLEDRPEVAEVSFLVEDAMQRRGIGTVLLDTLAEVARDHGITRFSADVMADNRVMLSVFRKAGYALSSNISYGVSHLEFPILRSEIAEARREAQEAEAKRASLRSVFAPKTVAVIGASRDPASVGGALFRNLLRWGFTGTVYPINPAARSIAGVKAYATVGELSEAPELALIAVPAAEVIEIARQCAAAGVHALCVLSAGFAETGAAGAAAQRDLLDVCRASGMRLVGPNCMGIVNTAGGVRMLGMFAPFEPPAGNVAMITQSGALGLALMAQAGQLSLGVSTFISVGNKADVSSNDLLQYWEADESTEVILLYLESFGNPRYFARLARRVSRAKPIVAVKSGRTTRGLQAAASHTAALAHSDRAADALFEQTGVIRVDTLAEFFSVARLLAAQPIPAGRRLGILTNGGGPGVIAVDAAIAGGLDVPRLSADTQARLRELLPNAASLANPVDIIASGGPKEYQAALELLCDDPGLDALVVIFIPPLATSPREVAQVVSDVLAARPQLKKPVTAVFFDPYSPLVSIPITEQREGARARRSVPVFTFPESAVAALSAAVRYGAWRAAPTGTIVEVPFHREAARAILDAHDGADWLPPEAVAQLLQTVGIDLAPANAAEVVAEVIAGVTHDPIFGPLVAFGSGGHLVELLDDAAFRVLPLTDRDAAEMIRATRAHRLLRGYRGASAGDISAVELLLLRLGALADAFPEIAEVDLNPVLVHPPGQGVTVRKARVRLVGEPGREESLCPPLL